MAKTITLSDTAVLLLRELCRRARTDNALLEQIANETDRSMGDLAREAKEVLTNLGSSTRHPVERATRR